MDNTLAFLALNRIPGIGPKTIKIFLNHWPDLEDMFRLSEQELEQAGLFPRLARAIIRFDRNRVKPDLQWEKTPDQTLLTWSHPLYPALLKEIPDPPPVLYAKGDLTALQQPCIAMVGTRKPSIAGRETAYRFAQRLAEKNMTIVSGLALGIDAEAHAGCLHAHGKTIAVLGCGIDRIYPRQHEKLALKLAETGLILSEFPLGTQPEAGHFPRRNRIISGISSITLVVEAALKSGSLITARFALEQNRDVLAIPGSIHNQQASGCHYLLKQGARLVTSVDEVLEETQELRNNRMEKSRLADRNQNLVKFIGFDAVTIDQIVQRSGFKVEDVVCDLAELELHGRIAAVPGGYVRCG